MDSTTNPTEEPISINIKFPPESFSQPLTFPPTSNFSDLLVLLTSTFPSYDWAKSKALIEKKPSSSSSSTTTTTNQLKKSVLLPSPDAELPLSALNSSTVRLLAPSLQTLSALTSAKETYQIRSSRSSPSPYPTKSSSSQSSSLSSSSSQFTFHLLRSLPHLPDPSAALSLLHRLKADPGIRAVMARDRLSVQLLTEMDPLSNTSSSASGVTRLLGLNRNKGEAIELRLRTDDYAGFRDYKTIRRTLCHELAHNTHSEHDKDFWALTRRYEREVERISDTGRTVDGGGSGYYAPERGGGEEEEEEVHDHGGWTGGEYVLGGGGIGNENQDGVLTSREIRARAAEARLKKAREEQEGRR